jgi:ATP-dependent Clp protease ATP-binding subunit ClpA
VDLLLIRVKQQLAGQEMELVVTDAAKDSIIVAGYDQAFGARPLRREIQNQIEDPLAERMLMASFSSGDTIIIDALPEGGLSIEKRSGKEEPVEAGSGAK